MEILHISAECYPVAKVGGLADVVGALPKYQNKFGDIAKVAMPCYKTNFFEKNNFEIVHEGGVWTGDYWRHFNVFKEKDNKLGFDLYLIDIPGLLDRGKPYGFYDDQERFTAFQKAVLNWLNSWADLPDVVHCHDHHSGLIPFMMTQCFQYQRLKEIPTVFTIHNAQYQGWMGWDKFSWIPAFDNWKSGLLDWDNNINSMAAGVRCAWSVTTVSCGYLEEIKKRANGLENLFQYEAGKCVGIVNGIDPEVWNPKTDRQIVANYGLQDVTSGKKANKIALCKQFGLNPRKPLVSFIGRAVPDKGVDLLPEVIDEVCNETDGAFNFLVLGSGNPDIEWGLKQLRKKYKDCYNVFVGYNEKLSHQIYAGTDFLLMPSRVEPCGLNQLYSLCYGSIPIVSSVGGLKDTVVDFGDKGGYGIRFLWVEPWDISRAIIRGKELFKNHQKMYALRKRMMKIDCSWTKAVKEYSNLYLNLK
ncbi:MAG TPA: glycogen/starch synthase [Chitinophagaceae bacterium]|nr:glycogen/starch synthase [Chitinophagaceae bacterium]